MKKVLLSLLLIGYSLSYGQTTIWSDDFETTAANWSLNVSTGTNDATYSNVWNISDAEGGVTPPGCNVSGNGNKTLFISCNPAGPLCSTINPSGQAKYNAGGIPSVDPTTHKRSALTTAISTVGQTGLTLTFDWVGEGQAGNDYAVLEYSVDGGTTWTSFWTESQTTTCGSGTAQWESASVPLPAVCENIADLRFAFNWQNNNDGVGTDPSFAVDNLVLTASSTPTGTPPVASFQTPLAICIGDCINLTDLSTGTNVSAWSWTFTGADTPTSTDQNPSNICYQTAGSYPITLEITDDNGTDDTTITITVSNCSIPNADFTTSSFTICKGDCIKFSDLSTGTNISAWNWTFAGADTPSSTDQNPTNICYQTPGTYNVTLEITDDNGTDTKTYQIKVDTCGTTSTTPPTAAFTIDTMVICQGDCISFTDQSTGDPNNWFWQFTGANVATSTMQNPTNICFDSTGTFSATLIVSNAYGSDTISNPITVDPAPIITATGDTTIKIGGVAVLTATPGEPGYLFWTPADNLDCDTCQVVNATPYLTTTYYPSLTGANGCTGNDTVVVTVKFEEIIDVPSGFSPNGDGLNDSLHVLGIGIRTIDFKIYNRYGQLVFSTTNINKGWGGDMNGKPLNQGVFVYTLKYTLVNGQSGEKSGNVTLIK